MSAYIVADTTINTILSHTNADDFRGLLDAAAATFTLDEGERGDADLGEAMRLLNTAAVLQRYPDCSLERGDLPGPVGADGRLPAYAYAPLLVSAVPAYKALRCLLYQCAEGTIPTTPLYQALDALSNRWAQEIVCKLPEYDRAVWG